MCFQRLANIRSYLEGQRRYGTSGAPPGREERGFDSEGRPFPYGHMHCGSLLFFFFSFSAFPSDRTHQSIGPWIHSNALRVAVDRLFSRDMQKVVPLFCVQYSCVCGGVEGLGVLNTTPLPTYTCTHTHMTHAHTTHTHTTHTHTTHTHTTHTHTTHTHTTHTHTTHTHTTHTHIHNTYTHNTQHTHMRITQFPHHGVLLNPVQAQYCSS